MKATRAVGRAVLQLMAACLVVLPQAAPGQFGGIAGAQPAADASDETGKRAELAQAFGGRLDEIARRVDGIVSYLVVDLTSGQRFSRKADEPFPTASAIKIGILYELFRQADEGRVQLDERRPLDEANKVGGAGILQQLDSPALSPRDHAVLMILLSDNTATNVLIELVGMDAVNRRMAALGTTTFALERRMMDVAAAAGGAENLSSAADLVLVMDAIRRGEGLTAASREAALDILRRPGATSLRAAVPAGVAVASKPGGLDGVRTEVAFVDLKGRPYVMAVMSSFLADEADGSRAITELSREAYRYFNRLARAGREGRLR